MDVLTKLQTYMTALKWTEYRLVKETGLPYSTVANIFHRGTQPSIATLEKMCEALGISLSQFFCESQNSISLEQWQVWNCWQKLTPKQRQLLLALIDDITASHAFPPHK